MFCTVLWAFSVLVIKCSIFIFHFFVEGTNNGFFSVKDKHIFTYYKKLDSPQTMSKVNRLFIQFYSWKCCLSTWKWPQFVRHVSALALELICLAVFMYNKVKGFHIVNFIFLWFLLSYKGIMVTLKKKVYTYKPMWVRMRGYVWVYFWI